MNSFVETLSPAARNHAEARIDYYTDLSQAVLHSLRQLSELNVQFGRAWLEESASSLQYNLLTPPSERQAQNAPQQGGALLQKLQQYHQQLAQVATEFQSEINKVAQEHVPQAARTATELADAGRQAAGKHFSDEASRFANVAAQNQAFPQAASVQSAPEGNKN
ncbi:MULTISPECIES: phasin family protein [unclassified Duganella]|jgi:DNA anti-recombination protein RmuC|uniref:phasin family protein n=1 Tax=unclassified Duganella TaxID=2636909 RepID=UPI0008833881|nr:MULTISPECIES: phasin family protein [unclassified Duganella]SDG38529.1 Phasin protein [Duganella sp. OV458]SDJ65198.1 Phasin protein [Duganella sp. OV510]